MLYKLQKTLGAYLTPSFFVETLTVLVKFSPPPEFDLSKKLILVTAPPKGTCPRKSCEIQGGGLNLTTTVKVIL